MATQTPTFESSTGDSFPREESRPDFGSVLNAILAPLASLKLTVVLFALSILIVLFGTLAQAWMDIWEVIDTYFRVDLSLVFTSSFPWIHPEQFFVKVPFQIFFPPAFTRVPWEVAGWFPFPKGWLIGLVMAFNLLAAHTVRFKTQARGSRLLIGLLVLAFGAIVTWAVIMSGSGKGVVQTAYAIKWEHLWAGMQVSLVGLVLAMGYGLFFVDPAKKWHRYLLGLGILLAAPLLVWMFWNGSKVPIDDSGMRILWQLVKGTLAGGILLMGCILVFKKRAGIVLLHAGIGLMMFYEVLVGVAADEGQMLVAEGATVNFTRDIREPELAISRPVGDDKEQVTVIPYSVLKKYLPEPQKEGEPQIPGEIISDEELPFDLRIDEYHANSPLVDASGADQKKVTGGLGKEMRPEPRPPVTGASKDQDTDHPAAYISFYEKGHHDQTISKNLFWVSSGFIELPEKIDVGDQTYSVSLRFKRTYQPYSVTLKDVSKEDYEGTAIPRDYSSDFVLVDNENGNKLDAHISMNNPLRYGGQTFYQSGYHPLGGGKEATTLAVVTNTGWMTPYVACMIVAVGMMAQFLITLTRFLNRRALNPDLSEGEGVEPILHEEPALNAPRIPATIQVVLTAVFGRNSLKWKIWQSKIWQPVYWFPLLTTLLCCFYLGGKLRAPHPARGEMNLYRFGQIPVRDEGRLKPIDTFARNTLRILSRKVEFVDLNENPQPAIKFLLDVMTPLDPDPEKYRSSADMPTKADAHRVFYVENDDAREFLGLPKRKGFLYSYDELQPNFDKLFEHLRQLEMKKAELDARKDADEDSGQDADEDSGQDADKDSGQNAESRSFQQTYSSLMNLKLRELYAKRNRYRGLKVSFIPPPVTPDVVPRLQDIVTNPEESLQMYLNLERLWSNYPADLEEANAPLVIPVMNTAADEDGSQYAGKWQSYPWSYVKSQLEPGMYDLRKILYAKGILKQEPDVPSAEPNPLIEQFSKILEAYAKGKDGTGAFNDAVAGYLAFLHKSPPPDMQEGPIRYEAYFNNTYIYYYAAVVSIGAFILGLGSWIGWSEPLRRSAFWIIAILLVVHTFGIISRIYISGRPPVTNLYSSAIFIGWGAIALGLLMEWLYPIGIAVVISSAMSFGTLLIAHFLSIGEDTIGVLQAVLDTQFWLATHVVCITFGYATTFVAGFLGLAYFVRGMLTPTLTRPLARDLARMIYGILCFAIFFSFVGTVLGGLWADDSWGRFWGWDPKENGALIIVLWNALVLHARWGGMVKDRGLAVLAMTGNIVTSWSWFGVNQLGVGLHSYGFTDGVLRALAIFFFIQLTIIIIAAVVPQREWWSFRLHRAESGH